MPVSWKRRLLARVGLDARSVGPDSVLAGRRGRLTLDALDKTSWVVQRQRGARRTVRRMGPPEARTHLVVDDVAARRHGLPQQQLQLLHYIGAEHVGWALGELDINCVLDVGANVGQFGQRLRGAGYTGRIVSFEPLPHLAEQLHQHADPDPNWHVMPYALGEEDTSAEMTVVAQGGKTSSLLPASEFGKQWSPRLKGIRREQVQVRRLDGLFDEAVAGLADPRVFLKMDTQGYDLRVFTGAGDRIKDVLGLQSELSCVPIYEGMPRLPEAIATFEQAGFEATGFFPVTRDRERLRLIELDIVMIRSEALPGR